MNCTHEYEIVGSHTEFKKTFDLPVLFCVKCSNYQMFVFMNNNIGRLNLLSELISVESYVRTYGDSLIWWPE